MDTVNVQEGGTSHLRMDTVTERLTQSPWRAPLARPWTQPAREGKHEAVCE